MVILRNKKHTLESKERPPNTPETNQGSQDFKGTSRKHTQTKVGNTTYEPLRKIRNFETGSHDLLRKLNKVTTKEGKRVKKDFRGNKPLILRK